MTAQREQDLAEILQRVDAWARAEREGDSEALKSILAPEFVGVGPLGFLLTCDQWLARFRSGDFRNTSLALSDISVRVFGDAAIVIGQQSSQGTYQGRPTGGEFRASLTFVRRSGAWRLVGLQYSGVVDAPPVAGARA